MTQDELEAHAGMLRRDMVGRSSPPETVTIEAGAIRKFARAIGETNPLYLDEAFARRSRYGRLIAPPTFPSCLIFGVMAAIPRDPGMRDSLHRVLHTDDIVENERPMMAGDVITSVARYADAFVRAGRNGPMLFEAIDVTQTDAEERRVALVRMVTVRY